MQRVYSRFSEIAQQGHQASNPNGQQGQGEADSATLTSEYIEQEIAACSVSPFYFITRYGYVTEPRPPKVEVDPDLDADFLAYFHKKKKETALDVEALALLHKDLAELAAENPTKSTELPFALWDYQEEALIWLQWLMDKGLSGAIEKCRDMGMSWVVLWYIIWCWRFRPGFQALVGSRKEAAVDNGKLDSLFGKLDYGISKLPDWLKPKGYVRAKHRNHLSIVNPELSGNFIAGESQTEEFGRSGRYTFVFLDEYAFWDQDVWGSVTQATKTVVAGSTVNGENQFYELTQRLRLISPRLVLRMEWDQNPNHDQDWYDRQKAQNSEATFAREVLINYQAAVEGKYFNNINLVKVTPNLRWMRGWPSFLSIDYGVRDDTAMIWWQKNPRPRPGEKRYRMMYCYFNSGKPIEFYFPIMRAEMPPEYVPVRDPLGNLVISPANGEPMLIENPLVYSDEDLAFIQMLQQAGVTHFLTYRGDPAGRNRNQDTAISIEQKLAWGGIEVDSFTKENDYRTRRQALSDVLLLSEINGEEKTRSGAWNAFNAIRQAKFQKRSDNSQSAILSEKPVHDWTSHYRSAAEYFAVGELAELGFSVSSALDQPGPTSVFGQGQGQQQAAIATIKEAPTGEQGALALLRELGIDPDELEEEEEEDGKGYAG